MQIKDRALRRSFAGFRRCELCGWLAYCVGHHVHRKGMGGGAWLDTPLNLVSLCRDCHYLADAYHVTVAELLTIVAAREKVLVKDVEAALLQMRRPG